MKISNRKQSKLPDFTFEIFYWNDGFTVIGIDEVGRGAFAGPVCVGGVVFDPGLGLKEKKYLLSLGINDSKKLSPKKRESLSKIIKKECLHYSISFIDVSIINKIGIGKATFRAMEEVYENISSRLTGTIKGNGSRIKSGMTDGRGLFALVDAFEIPEVSKNLQRGIIRGDSLSISIASASIIAKVARDELMVELGLKNPQYGWENNKGYGTLKHREAIKKAGITPLHRVDFCHTV